MTLLTHIRTDPSTHFWLADQLLSVRNPNVNKDWFPPIDLPTHHDANMRVPDESDTIIGLTQKLSLLDDGLLVGWAGLCDEAIPAIKKIYSARKSGYITDASALLRFLESVEMTEKSTIFCALVHTGESTNDPRRDHQFIVGPVHRQMHADYMSEVEAIKASPPDWNSQFTCIYGYTPTSRRVHVATHYAGGREPAVRFRPDGQHLDIEISPTCVQRLERWLE